MVLIGPTFSLTAADKECSNVFKVAKQVLLAVMLLVIVGVRLSKAMMIIKCMVCMEYDV